MADKEKAREDVERLQRSIKFIRSDLNDIRDEYNPYDLRVSPSSDALNTLLGRLEGIGKRRYKNALTELEKIRGSYPAEKRANILKKIETVKQALQSIDEVEKELHKIRQTLQGLPFKLFN